MAQNFPVTSLPRGFPPKAQTSWCTRAAYTGQLQKSSSLQNFATDCLMCSLTHMPEAKPYQETSSSTSTEHHKYHTCKAFSDTAPKVGPENRLQRCRWHLQLLCTSQPCSTNPAARPPPALRHPSLPAHTAARCDSHSKGDGTATPGSLRALGTCLPPQLYKHLAG